MTGGTDAGRSYWARNAAHYDRSMLLLGGLMPRVLERVASELVGAGGVLEIGAGTGLVTVAIASVAGRVVATDYAPAMIERLVDRVRRERLANVECRVADLQALEFEPGSFDAVVCGSLRAAVEEAGFEVDAAEPIQGMLPVAFVSGVPR